MSKKTIFNLAAAFTFSTLALATVAQAGDLSSMQKAKFAEMKKEHLYELNDIGKELRDIENQIEMKSLYVSELSDTNILETERSFLQDRAIKEITQFHQDVSLEFGPEAAKNIYTDAQKAQFKARLG